MMLNFTPRQGTLLCTKTEVRLAQTFPNLRRLNDYPIWVFPKIRGTPKGMVKIMENPIIMEDLGGKPTIFGNIHIGKTTYKSPIIFQITAEDLVFWVMFFGVRIPPTVVLYLQISTNFGTTFSKLVPMVVAKTHPKNDTNISNSRHELQVDHKNQST